MVVTRLDEIEGNDFTFEITGQSFSLSFFFNEMTSNPFEEN